MRFMSKAAGILAALPLAAILMTPGSLAATPQELVESAPAEAWRQLDPENTLYMDLPSGRIIIEMRPDFAPKHIERIKTLTRQGFYDGVLFHRVIEGFMAQGGDPTGTGRGGSKLPDIAGEFMRDASDAPGFMAIGRDARAARVGFIGNIPVGAQPELMTEFLVQDTINLWGMHCRGVMSMARAGNPDSANSQFFLMFGDSRRALDELYTVWGRVVDGIENARRISRGEPPERPTPIVRMRVAADVPPEDRSSVEIMRTNVPLFEEYLEASGDVSEAGYVSDICNVIVPTRIDGEIEL